MRIVSLLPSTTEILHALGAGADVVGVTFECDHPPQARLQAQVVSTSNLPAGTPAEIDAAVSERLAAGEDLYRLDRAALAGLDADLVVTQDLCAVCAVDVGTVDDALAHLGCAADVLTVDPHTLAEVLASIERLGAATGRAGAARGLVAGLSDRLEAVAAKVAGLPRPRVLVLEWTDPPYAPGHWLPEMVQVAGAVPALGTVGSASCRILWDDVRACQPDVVVCAPCGFTLPASADQARALLDAQLLPPDTPVWAVDANASFVRPGPRLVDGVEALAAIAHPKTCGEPHPLLAERLR